MRSKSTLFWMRVWRRRVTPTYQPTNSSSGLRRQIGTGMARFRKQNCTRSCATSLRNPSDQITQCHIDILCYSINNCMGCIFILLNYICSESYYCFELQPVCFLCWAESHCCPLCSVQWSTVYWCNSIKCMHKDVINNIETNSATWLALTISPIIIIDALDYKMRLYFKLYNRIMKKKPSAVESKPAQTPQIQNDLA